MGGADALVRSVAWTADDEWRLNLRSLFALVTEVVREDEVNRSKMQSAKWRALREAQGRHA